VQKLELHHDSLRSLPMDVMEDDLTGLTAWELIQERVVAAGVAWFKERLLDTVLFYVWPHMDEKVSTDLGHLIKAPFCAHAKARRVAVALCPQTYDKWNAALDAPCLDEFDEKAVEATFQHLTPRCEDHMDIEDMVAATAPAAAAPPPLRKVALKRKKSTAAST